VLLNCVLLQLASVVSDSSGGTREALNRSLLCRVQPVFHATHKLRVKLPVASGCAKYVPEPILPKLSECLVFPLELLFLAADLEGCCRGATSCCGCAFGGPGLSWKSYCKSTMRLAVQDLPCQVSPGSFILWGLILDGYPGLCWDGATVSPF